MTSFANLFCSILSLLSIVYGYDISLDVENDAVDNWTIKGNSIYAQTGKILKQAAISQYLPDEFHYTPLYLSKGIWVIVPNKQKNCAVFGSLDSESNELAWDWNSSEEQHDQDNKKHHGNDTSTTTARSTTTTVPPCDISNFASFQCTLKAQLLSSVRVKYNFGGNAIIRVTGGNRGAPFEARSDEKSIHVGWDHFKVDKLDGGSRVLIEAIVNGTGDYILIDSITVEILEPATTTTHRTTRHTTSATPPSTTTAGPPTESPTHEPAPISGQSGMLKFSGNWVIVINLLTTVVIIKSLFL